MDTATLIAAWLLEKHNNDQQKMLQEALQLLALQVNEIPEFKVWLQTKKTFILAMATPEALDAIRAERAQALATELALVEATIITAKVPDVVVPVDPDVPIP